MDIQHSSDQTTPAAAEFIQGIHSLIRNTIRLREFPDDKLAELFSKLSPEAQAQIIELLRPMQNEEVFEQAAIMGRDELLEHEQQRLPHENEPKQIFAKEILILSKRSRVELDCEKLNLDLEGLRKYYEANEERKIDDKFTAHNDHCQARIDLKTIIPEARWVNVWEESASKRQEILQDPKYKLVLVLGGDDTLKLVAPFIKDQFVVFCNSNATQSNGVMAEFDNHNIYQFLSKVLNGNFVVEDWTRIEAKITLPDGKAMRTLPAFNEIVLQDHNNLLTGRAEVLEVGHIKGTGALIATGAGSTGWFSSATGYRYPFGRKFSRTAPRAEYAVREPYGNDYSFSNKFAKIEAGEVLTIFSTSNNNLELSIDSQTDLRYPLQRASKVEISISDKPLKIINVKNS